MVNKIPSRDKWIADLASQGVELERIVSSIEDTNKRRNLYNVFLRSPFEKDGSGNFLFNVPSMDQPDKNLLKEFEGDINSVREYALAELMSRPYGAEVINNSKNNDWLIVLSKDRRMLNRGSLGKIISEPKVFLYLDTNIVLDSDQTANCFFNRGLPSGFVPDMVTIINYELLKGGLPKKFGNLVPQDIESGKQSLEKRCGMLPHQKKEIDTLFEIIKEVYNREMGIIFSEANDNYSMDPYLLARKIKDDSSNEYSKHPKYQSFVSKIIEKYRSGNPHNYIADKILTSTSFGLNLLDQKDKGIIISNDGDIDVNFEIFYSEILPRYMGNIVYNSITNKQGKKPEAPKKDFIKAARRQIAWARDSDKNNELVLGISYNPEKNEFYTRKVSLAFRYFFNGIESYRIDKGDLISEMVKTGEHPDKIVERLMKDYTPKSNLVINEKDFESCSNNN